ncbi:MlaA family lipoprotein [[Pseudomonas] boreopolis]|uniref:MlaA family lipoprotein n=1 Tax=Xanthomonas boreopolis TaxID=86183 RepID=UPI003D5976FB
MNVLRPLVLVPLLLLAACAGQAPKSAPPAAASVVAAPAAEATPAAEAPASAPADAGEAPAAAAPAEAPSASAAGTAPTAAEDDYAALYGGPAPSASADAAPAGQVAYDPWERYNRGMHRFNLAVDKYFARPVATAYVNVTPEPVRLGVTNFFDNLRSPVTLVNQLLQGHPVRALQTLGRFVMNTTLGIGGLFDPASAAGIPRGNGDFGQTLGVWGWRNSRYFELPFFGPRTLRDTFGLAGDMPLSPLRQVENDKVRIGLQGVQLVNTRARLLSLDEMRNEAPDEYALTRDAWLQRRNYQIQQSLHRNQKDGEQLPDYLRDDNTVPADAMPVPQWGG